MNIIDKLFKSLMESTTFSNWLIGSLVKYGMSKIILPCLKVVYAEGLYYLEVKSGQVKIAAIKDAENKKDSDDYDQAVDNIFS